MSNYPDPSNPQVPGNGMPQYPGNGMPQYPANGTPQYPGNGVPQFPDQGLNPYGMPNGFGPNPTEKNWMGITALVCGCLVLLCGLFTGIPAIIFGAMGMNAAGRGEATNRGMAIAGLVLGVISVVMTIIWIALGGFEGVFDSVNNAK
ncbi:MULTISPECIES: DUF4190 domain-containing protein [Actinomyces]|uniref:DUF4190 domain-containing protein n=1 Tax=Actinomyces marmotae TaxID=2737173 RepID=A0A6M8B1I8_9ACTO|nr:MULTISPECIES: DUF4190 domain-containing protein [Actinomyces]QKD79672.1 DUF4190 domain-containing protein [Actinomyces marmotae]